MNLIDVAKESMCNLDNTEIRNYYNHTWIDYDILKYDLSKKQEQIRLHLSTGLYDTSNGIEFVFVPTERIQLYENILKELYTKLSVEGHITELCNEVFYTAKIEGANTTIKRTKQLYNGEYIDVSNYKSEKMVLNGFHATKYLNLVPHKLDIDIILRLWNIVVDGVCENEDIRGDRFRIDSVQVRNHVGLYHGDIEEAMSNWVNYYNSNNLQNTPFSKAALLHYAFEYIHPFCDGNGRTGRFLMNNFLINNGYEKLKAVSFTRGIEKDLRGYYTSLSKSNNAYTDCTPFIEWMLENMVKTLSELVSEDK